jgi:hypothetical protein
MPKTVAGNEYAMYVHEGTGTRFLLCPDDLSLMMFRTWLFRLANPIGKGFIVKSTNSAKAALNAN